MRGAPISYTDEELSWIEQHKTDVRKTAHSAFCKLFNRTDVSFKNYNGLCKRNGWLTGRTGCFAKGDIPANKGKKMPFNANSAATQFKKGNKPHNTNYLGHERVSKDGYVEISVDEINPHTGYYRRYVLKHRHEWEKQNGKIPEGHCLKCMDGNKQNTSLNNWECIPREILPRLSGKFGRKFDEAEPEIKPLIMAVTILEHETRKRSSNV